MMANILKNDSSEIKAIKLDIRKQKVIKEIKSTLNDIKKGVFNF